MIQPVGPRIVIRPIVPAASKVLTLTDRQFQQMGRVLAIGDAYCPDCGMTKAQLDVVVGDVVLFHTSVGHEIEPTGDIIIGFQDVLGVYQPDSAEGAA